MVAPGGPVRDNPAVRDRDQSAADDVAPATFLLADLAGYSALTEAHGDEHAADTAAAFVREVRRHLAGCAGEEVKTIGDALLVRIFDAGEAVRLAERIVSEQSARHRALGVRVGMHTGTAVRRDGDWFGAAVNLAARIADQARAGEVVMSAATVEAAGAAVRDRVRSRGAHRLKNVSRPVDLFVLEGDGEPARPRPVDPVCRMGLDPDQAHGRQVHRGVEYHFCSPACFAAFAAAPDDYAPAP